jgi:predicted nucleic acid-binding protein
MKLILDSSVIAKLFLEESGSEGALEIMESSYIEDLEIIASDLIFYEVGNTIWKHIRKKNKDGTKYINKLYLLNINYIPLNEDLAVKAMKLAQKHDITYYDGVHIALGQELKSKLVTEDKLLLSKFDSAINIEGAIGKIEKLE